jgi:hypothetical protein
VRSPPLAVPEARVAAPEDEEWWWCASSPLPVRPMRPPPIGECGGCVTDPTERIESKVRTWWSVGDPGGLDVRRDERRSMRDESFKFVMA